MAAKWKDLKDALSWKQVSHASGREGGGGGGAAFRFQDVWPLWYMQYAPAHWSFNGLPGSLVHILPLNRCRICSMACGPKAPSHCKLLNLRLSDDNVYMPSVHGNSPAVVSMWLPFKCQPGSIMMDAIHGGKAVSSSLA